MSFVDEIYSGNDLLDHAVSIREDAIGTNYRVECSCGYLCNVATTRSNFAIGIAGEHLKMFLSDPDPFVNL